MMRRLVFILVLLEIYIVKIAVGNKVDYSGQQVWRVTPNSPEEVKSLRELEEKFEVDFWTEPTSPGRFVDFRVKPKQFFELANALNRMSGYEIYISDVQSLIINEKLSHNKRKNLGKALASSVQAFDYSQYHPAKEVYQWMDLVTSEYSFATKEQFGVTFEGRPLYVLKFEKPSAKSKPTIVVDALIHCREWITTASLMFIFKEMLQNPSFTHMMDEVNWYFVPMINVDGYVETWIGDRLWRKTRSTGPNSNCPGVDANRNFDSYWSNEGASGNPCAFSYYGPTPESESEVRHLVKYVMGQGKIDAYVTTHSYTQLILYPYGYTSTPCADDAVLNATSKLMHDAMKAVHGKTYTYGPSSTTIYVTSGTTTDWSYDVAGIVQSYTFELRDTGRYGFILPADQIIPNGEEYLAGLEVLSNYVRDNYEGSGM
ncbi:carboxypeptidase B-like [Styela clava]